MRIGSNARSLEVRGLEAREEELRGNAICDGPRDTSTRPNKWPVRDVCGFALIAAIAIAVNLTKAAHMDDGAHMAIAQAILHNPLHPMTALINWDQVPEPIHVLNQPHLFFYLMAPIMKVARNPDVALHAFESAFALMALALFYRLARLIAHGRALFATALLGLGPAFLPSSNVMVDIPVLATWCGFFLYMARAGPPTSATYSAAPYWKASTFAAAACLIKYNSLLLIPVFVVLIARKRAWRALWALTVPFAALMAWGALNLHDYGAIHLLGRRLGSGTPGEDIGTVVALMTGRLPLWIVGIGAVCPFALPVAMMMWRRNLARPLIGCAVAGVVVAVAGLIVHLPDLPATSDLEPMDAVLRGVFFANGLVVAVLVRSRAASHLRKDGSDSKEDVLFAWLAVAALSAVVLAPFPAIRHVLLVLPPVLLFITRDAFAGHERRVGNVAIVLTAVLGVGVAIADVRQADVYRQEAFHLAHLPGRVWYVGHWGWGVYAARNGMKEYEPGGSALMPGDTVVIPQNVHEQRVSEGDRHRLVLSYVDVVPGDRLSLLRTVTRAGGFYYYWGAVPWTFRTGPLERFSIYSVR